jgi:hypothetical protein
MSLKKEKMDEWKWHEEPFCNEVKGGYREENKEWGKVKAVDM